MSDDDSDDLGSLLLAAKTGNIAKFSELLNEGADVLQKDKNDRTVLHLAAQSGVISVILAGVSIGLARHINTKSKPGLTPLHEACLAGNAKVTHMLLALGADVTAQTKEGYTALLCAAGNGHCDVTKLLVGAGCDPNQIIQPIGVNAVHIATWTGQAEVLDTLLQMGANVDEKSQIGKTAMEFAVEQQNTECIAILQKHTAKFAASSHADQIKTLKAKMKRAEDKIHAYFENKLQQEIQYFEKQLQDQHEEDMGIIVKLQNEVSRLQSILGKEQAQLVRGQPLRSHRPDIIDLNRIPSSGQLNVSTGNSPRSTGLDARHSSRLSESSDKQDGSPDPDSPDFGMESDDHPESTKAPLQRLKSAKDMSIGALVEESSRKTNSISYIRKQSMETEGMRSNQIHRTASAGAVTLAPSRPLSRTRRSVETTPTSPIIKMTPGGPFSGTSSVSSPTATSPGSPKDFLQVANASTSEPKTRRKSLTMLLRPIFFGDDSNKKDTTRRRSVVTTIPDSPSVESQQQEKKIGMSLPLPGIQAVSDQAEGTTHDKN